MFEDQRTKQLGRRLEIETREYLVPTYLSCKKTLKTLYGLNKLTHSYFKFHMKLGGGMVDHKPAYSDSVFYKDVREFETALFLLILIM